MKKLRAAGVQVVGISYDSTKTLKKFAEQAKITFPLLSDTKSKVIDAYRVRNHSVRKGSRQDGIPHPITMVVTKDGRIGVKLPGSVVRRHSTDDLVQAVKRLK